MVIEGYSPGGSIGIMVKSFSLEHEAKIAVRIKIKKVCFMMKNI